MVPSRSRVVRLLIAVSMVVACERRNASVASDSAATPGTRSKTSTGPNDWSGELGQMLLVPSDSENTAIVLMPQGSPSQLKTSTPVTLVGANGDTALARIDSVVSDSVECGDAPLVRL